MTTPFQRNPPKSITQIRSSLESMHETADVNTKSGPLRRGVANDFPIAIGSFYDPDLARDFQQELSQASIFSKLVSTGSETGVLVDDEDRHRANELFQEHRRQHPNRRPQGSSRRFDFTIFGLGIALSASFVLVFGRWSHPLALIIPLTFGAIGGSVGYVADQIRLRYWQTGHFRIGIRDFLVLATIPAMIALASNLLPKILFD